MGPPPSPTRGPPGPGHGHTLDVRVVEEAACLLVVRRRGPPLIPWGRLRREGGGAGPDVSRPTTSLSPPPNHPCRPPLLGKKIMEGD